MAATRKVEVRVVALALACGANASLFLLMWFAHTSESPEPVAPSMIWMSMPVPVQPTPVPPPPDQPRSRAPARDRLPAPIVVSPSPEQSTAITLPRIDWYAESARAARKAFPDNAQVKPDTSQDSKPKDQGPGLSSAPHKAGDSERRDGGETITWINETCYISNRPVAPPTMAGEFQMLRPVCKVRSMKERKSEKDAAGLEKPQPTDSSNPFPNLP
jgi:hypothetical protein